jgi:hypothetical protein
VRPCISFGLPASDQARLGVTEEQKNGPHQLTYRQAERTFGLITRALKKEEPDGTPSAALTTVLDDLLEASIPGEHKNASASLAADWTDVESFSRPPHHGRGWSCGAPGTPAPGARCSSATTSRPPR